MGSVRTPSVACLLLLLSGCGAFATTPDPQEVEKVELMKDDPLLNREIRETVSSDRSARAASSSGGGSSASAIRVWSFTRPVNLDDFERYLTAAVADGVRVDSLFCEEGHVGSVAGVKMVGRWTASVFVELRVEPAELHVLLTVGYGPGSPPSPPVPVEPGGDCPAGVLALLP